MASRLNPDELTAALQALPGWQLRGQALTRTVVIPAGAAALLRSVEQLADQLHHGPYNTVLDGDSLTVRLPTAGDITELDVEFAARIDQVLSGSHATGTAPGHRTGTARPDHQALPLENV